MKYQALLTYIKDIFRIADIHTPYYLVPDEVGSAFESALAETYGRLVEGITEGTLTQEQLDIIGSCFQNPPPRNLSGVV